jgi:hypothetical protein
MTQSASIVYNQGPVLHKVSSLTSQETLPVENQSRNLLPEETFKGFLHHGGSLFYANRIRFTFKVSSHHYSNLGLLKGLIDFHRPQGFAFTINRADNTISADVPYAQQELLISFLDRIKALLEKELAFKKHLKKILLFEDTIKQATAQAYAGLTSLDW